MSHFIICSSSVMIFGMPNGQASTQFEQAIQRGLSDDCTTPSSVFLMAFMNQSASDVADKRTNPGQTAPNCWRKNPSNNGGKNPPKPPSAPTNPPTVPVSFGKNCGTSLKTAPLPKPSSAAQPSAPTVNGNIAGQASSSANNPMPGNTPASTRAPPMRSESQPPTGRNSVASTTNPAARKPASGMLRPNSSRSSSGK